MTAVPLLRLPDVEIPAVRSDASTMDVVRHALGMSVRRLLDHDAVVRAGHDPEGVHQARVATRRLRSDLVTFRPVLQRSWADTLRKQLRPLAQQLGAVRDAEVLIANLERTIERIAPGERASARPILSTLKNSRASARRELMTDLNSAAYGDLLEQLAVAAAAPHLSGDALRPATETLPPLAKKAWDRLRRTVAALPVNPSDESLHRIRILAKRARYAIEATSPVARHRVTAFASRLADVQEALGRHHDAVVTEAWLRQHLMDADGSALALGQLIALQRLAAAVERAMWPQLWKRVERNRPRRWV